MTLAAWTGPARLARFALVGASATVAYGVLVWLFSHSGLRPVAASVVAYLGAGGISYLGHRRITFRSSGAHGVELPRFIVTLAAGIAVAAAAPSLLVVGLGLPQIAATLTTCVAAPLMSYLALSLLVFAPGRGPDGSPSLRATHGPDTGSV